MTCQSNLQCSNTTSYRIAETLRCEASGNNLKTTVTSCRVQGISFFHFLPKQRQAISWRGIFMKFSDNNISFNISFFSKAHFLHDQKITVIQAWRDLPSPFRVNTESQGLLSAESWQLSRINTYSFQHLYQGCFSPFILRTFCMHKAETCFISLWSRLAHFNEDFMFGVF